MHDLNGLELIRRVKSLKPSTRTLLMTAAEKIVRTEEDRRQTSAVPS